MSWCKNRSNVQKKRGCKITKIYLQSASFHISSLHLLHLSFPPEIKVALIWARASKRHCRRAEVQPWRGRVPGSRSACWSAGSGRVGAAGGGEPLRIRPEVSGLGQGGDDPGTPGPPGIPGLQDWKRCFPSDPGSGWRWSFWPSAGRTSYHHGSCADRPRMSPYPSLLPPRVPSRPWGNGSRPPGSQPFPLLDFSCSEQMNKKKFRKSSTPFLIIHNLQSNHNWFVSRCFPNFTSSCVFSSSSSLRVSRLWLILSLLRFSIWGLEIWRWQNGRVNTGHAFSRVPRVSLVVTEVVLPAWWWFSEETQEWKASCWMMDNTSCAVGSGYAMCKFSAPAADGVPSFKLNFSRRRPLQTTPPFIWSARVIDNGVRLNIEQPAASR